MRIHAQEARGSLVIECCPAEIKHLIDVWGEPGTNFRMMQRLKQQFDPHQRFVRGRFLGGL
jgi:glycolate oxidase FAD binding subunit